MAFWSRKYFLNSLKCFVYWAFCDLSLLSSLLPVSYLVKVVLIILSFPNTSSDKINLAISNLELLRITNYFFHWCTHNLFTTNTIGNNLKVPWPVLLSSALTSPGTIFIYIFFRYLFSKKNCNFQLNWRSCHIAALNYSLNENFLLFINLFQFKWPWVRCNAY